MTLMGFEPGLPAWKSNAPTTTLQSPYNNKRIKYLYLNYVKSALHTRHA